MKRLSSTGPSIFSHSTPVKTDLQLDFVLLITTLWAQQFSQLSVHLIVHFSSLYFVSLSLRLLQETVLKAKIKVKPYYGQDFQVRSCQNQTFSFLSYTTVEVLCPGQVTESLSVSCLMRLNLRFTVI